MGHSYSHQDTPPARPSPEPIPDGHPLGTSLPPTSYMDSTTSSSFSSSSSPVSQDDCSTRSCLYFTFSKQSTVLFQNWKVESDFEFWMAIGGIMALALLYEMVKSFRSCLLLEAQAQAAAPENKPILLRDLGRNYPPEDQSGLDCLQHFLCSLFYMLEWTLFFLICLVVIGFNIWNLLAAITGLSLGYLLFGKGRLN